MRAWGDSELGDGGQGHRGPRHVSSARQQDPIPPSHPAWEGISSACQLSYITEVFFLARTEPVFPPEEQQHLIKPPSPLLWSLASGRLGPILQEGPGEAEPCAAYSCCSSAQRWQHFTGGQRRAWDTVGTFILLSALGVFRPKAVCKIKVIRCLGFSKSQRNSGLL